MMLYDIMGSGNDLLPHGTKQLPEPIYVDLPSMDLVACLHQRAVSQAVLKKWKKEEFWECSRLWS